ncbi:MAG: precorrin-4 C(11)-methyltransferase [Candidatus Thermoplasmatota archaeon]|nr:precorrin-4 C(11)-methyltransferase [Candidatus Thermoplasmatota archaeon]
MRGKVYFIGAGPGSPDLITVRGMTLLSKADLVVYADSLVSEAMLKYCKGGAEIVGSSSMTLEETNLKIVRAVEEGKTVARLHSGDPSVYGALTEQIRMLKEHDVDMEVVPGISSAFAAAASIGMELTVPGISQSIIFTRIPKRTERIEAEDPVVLARLKRTMVFFLSALSAGDLTKSLLEAGWPEDSKAAIFYRISWPEEKIILTEISRLEEEIRKEKLDRQVLIIVGPAVQNLFADSGKRSMLYNPRFSHRFRVDRE